MVTKRNHCLCTLKALKSKFWKYQGIEESVILQILNGVIVIPLQVETSSCSVVKSGLSSDLLTVVNYQDFY